MPVLDRQRRPDPADASAEAGVAATPSLADAFRAVRARSLALAAPLSPEDAMVQSMPDASPAKWHLAHSTWFFERFVLGDLAGQPPQQPDWHYLFNSYYQGAGPMHERARRGLLSRPGLDAVLDYRARVDDRLQALLDGPGGDAPALRQRVTLGLQHEQQHQELLLTDIKHAFWSNPLQPAYRAHQAATAPTPATATDSGWEHFDEGIVEIGAPPWPGDGDAGFAYDSESPRHRVLVPAHALARRPVSNAGFQAFVEDGGYDSPALWLSEGWARVQAEGWRRPLYWHADGAREFTLAGWQPREPAAPACHLSYFEADAFARWAGARLPTEAEWEQAAAGQPVHGHFADDGLLHPRADPGEGLRQLFGDVWEWTASAYSPYPGFRPLPGALGEYNGKFMCGQWVLRGGSCATPAGHVRASYRNFFLPPDRWQFSGLRLAKDPT